MLQDTLDRLPFSAKNVICILSGGLDSTILLYLLKVKYKDNVHALSFNYNQRHTKELDYAKKSTKITKTPHKILNIDFFGDLVSPATSLTKNTSIDVPNLDDLKDKEENPITMVPFRNMLFTTLAFSYAETINAKYVFLGIQQSDLYGYWDCTDKFVEKMNGVSSLNPQIDIKVVAPFVKMTKRDEILLGNELQVPFENTWSCYNGLELACGKCPTCRERLKAFSELNLTDPLNYSEAIENVSI